MFTGIFRSPPGACLQLQCAALIVKILAEVLSRVLWITIKATVACTRRTMVAVTMIRGASGAWGVRVSVAVVLMQPA